MPDEKNDPWYRRPIGGWKLGAAIGLSVLVGLIVGAAAGSDQATVDDLTAQVDSLNADLDDAQQQYGDALAEKSDLSDELDRAKARARTAERRAKKDAEAQLADQKADLRDQEAKLDQRAAKLEAAQHTLESNTIPDGIWQSGRDFEPGLYRASGGSSCYWAKLGSANTGDIEDNGLGKNPTVQIDSPFFETDGCGKWTKIG